MARLRGGISDLLEILALEVGDDYQFGYSVVNALSQLENQCYVELIMQTRKVFSTELTQMLYEIPDHVGRIAWNGTYLFYLGKDNKSLIRCVGDIKKANFGKELN